MTVNDDIDLEAARISIPARQINAALHSYPSNSSADAATPRKPVRARSAVEEPVRGYPSLAHYIGDLYCQAPHLLDRGTYVIRKSAWNGHLSPLCYLECRSSVADTCHT